jgi:hypothetical protein
MAVMHREEPHRDAPLGGTEPRHMGGMANIRRSHVGGGARQSALRSHAVGGSVAGAWGCHVGLRGDPGETRG